MTKPIPINYCPSDIRDSYVSEIMSHLEFMNHKTRKHVRKCLKKPVSCLLPFLAKHLYDNDKQHYIGVHANPYAYGKNGDTSASLVNRNVGPEDYPDNGLILFCNALSVPKLDRYDAEGKPVYLPASTARTVNTGVYIHTLEFDTPSEDPDEVRSFLAEQIGWSHGVNNSIKGVYDHMCRYADFRGIEFIWGGHKSCHLHIAFDVRHLSPSRFKKTGTEYPWGILPDLPDNVLRDGFISAWEQLPNIAQNHTKSDVFPDPRVAPPEQYRRLPWGIRGFTKRNAFGFDGRLGTPQAVLWSKFRNRANQADEWFHNPMTFLSIAKTTTPKSSTTTRSTVSQLDQEQEHTFIAEMQRLCESCWGGDYPKPVAIDSGPNGYKIFFQNDQADQKASSVMEGNHNRVLVQSRDPAKANGEWLLPFSADELMEQFIRHGQLSISPTDDKRKNILESIFHRELAKEATADKVRELLSTTAVMGALSSRLSLIFSMQGATKTTSLLKAIPYEDDMPEGVIIVACRSYQQAREKCSQFNKYHRGNQYMGVLVKSFTKVYSDVIGDDETLDEYDAANMGCRTVVEAVYQRGGEVVERLERYKRKLWNTLSPEMQEFQGRRIRTKKRPVLFMVHQVAQNWYRRGGTRLWLHEQYKDMADARTRGIRDKALSTAIYEWLSPQWIIHDEMNMDDLIIHHRKDHVDLCHRLRRKHPNWHKLTTPDQEARYENIELGQRPEGLNFSLCREILDANYCEDDLVEVDPSLEPLSGQNAQDSPYLSIKGNMWYVKARTWCRQDNYNITMLSTEHRIAAAVEYLRGRNDITTDPGVALFDFDTPDVFESDQTDVEVYIDNRARSKSSDGGKKDIEFLVGDVQTRWPGCEIISNIVDENGVTTHETAKGSNRFCRNGKTNVAVYTMIPPEQYEQLLLENAFFDRTDMVKMYYLDQFDQTCGRTLGFRHHPGTDAKAIMSKRLWREFGPALVLSSRYNVVSMGKLTA